jgi:hypothetical protein
VNSNQRKQKFPFYFQLSCATGLQYVSYAGIADGHRPVELNCAADSTKDWGFDWLAGDVSTLLGWYESENEGITFL